VGRAGRGGNGSHPRVLISTSSRGIRSESTQVRTLWNAACTSAGVVQCGKVSSCAIGSSITCAGACGRSKAETTTSQRSRWNNSLHFGSSVFSTGLRMSKRSLSAVSWRSGACTGQQCGGVARSGEVTRAARGGIPPVLCGFDARQTWLRRTSDVVASVACTRLRRMRQPRPPQQPRQRGAVATRWVQRVTAPGRWR